MWLAAFFPFLISAIKLRTEVEVLGCLDGLDGLIREGLGPLDGVLGTDLVRDGLTPLDAEDDITDALFGDGSRDPGAETV